MDSRIYWIWLQQALPLGCVAMGDLLDSFGHAREIYRADEPALLAAGIKKDYAARLGNKSLDRARAILNRVLDAGDWVLTPEDALYPLSLRHGIGCPAALYARGTMPDLDTLPAITVVGTRRASQEGRQEAYSLAAGLAAGGMAVVSGGAVGIDAAAHTGALDAGGKTIAVMACPLTDSYPKDNEALRQRIVREGGLLLTEFPHDEPYKCDFPVRNRLLVGLSQAVCLAETPVRSGARITARLAREQNREVFALPGSLSGHRFDGGNQEIQQGATLVMRAADILREYAVQYPGVLHLEAAEDMQRQLEGRSVPLGGETEPKVPEKAEKKPKEKRRARHAAAKAAAPKEPAPEAAPVACPDWVSPAAGRVYSLLSAEPRPTDTLADESGLPVPQLLAALTELEMAGCAENTAGGQYKLRT